MEDFTRRDFLKGVVGAGISLVAADSLSSETISSLAMSMDNNPYQATGLPLTELGSTVVLIPKIV